MKHLTLCKPFALASVISASLAVSPLVNANDDHVETIVVTATRTANSALEAPASISVITADDIQLMSGVNLNEIVSQAVGVESTKDGGRAGREFIKLRGMDSGFTLILLNGRRMSSSNAIIRGNDFDYSAIPPSSIERIEVIRGPMSSLYGSDALGGVINIITKQAENDWSGSVTGTYSTPEDNGGERLQLGVNVGGALIADELYANVSVNLHDRDAWMPYAADDEFGDRSGVTALENKKGRSILTNLTWLLDDKQTLSFDLGTSNDERDGNNETLSRGSSRARDFKQDVDRQSLAVTHNGEWSWGTSQVRIAQEDVDVKEGVTTVYDITESNTIIDASFTQTFGQHRLTYGGDIRSNKLENSRDLLSGETSVDQNALFVQDEWQLADGLTLTLGGRMDDHEEFGSHFTPRAYIVKSFDSGLVLKGGYAQAFRAPSLVRLSGDYRLTSCRGACQLTGNPDLDPETSDNYELSALYQTTGLNLELTVFRNDIEDLIARDLTTNLIPAEDGRLHTYQNIDEAQIKGVEVATFANITEQVSLRVNYTYLDAVDVTNDETLLERPEHSLMAKVTWNFNDDLSGFVQYNYTGEQAIDGDQTLDSYGTVDLGANYYLNDQISLRAGINNLGDEAFDNHVTVRGYNQAPMTMYIGGSFEF